MARTKSNTKHVATAKEAAAVDFKPYPTEEIAKLCEDISGPRWDEICQRINFEMRVTARLLIKTKPELVAIMADPEGSETFGDIAEHFIKTENWLRQAAHLLEQATMRLVVAGSVVEAES